MGDITKRLFLSFSLAISLAISLVSISAFSNQGSVEDNFSDAELAQILAPIALYPDSLLTHILIASTYPLEVIEANRWAKKNSDIAPENIANKVENLDWEPSVKALIPFPRILNRLSEDLSWTRQLGDAFLQDEMQVLQSIQVLRKQAELAGSLAQMDNMTVSKEDNNIIIQPVQQEVVYVPYYDTRVVYGPWHWSSYPPVHWGHHYPRYASHHNLFSWHTGIHISFDYFFSAFHWNNRHVVVVDHYNSRHYRQRRHIVTGHYAKRWLHKPHHRRGVAYRSSVTKERYASNRPSVSQSRHYRNEYKRNEQRNEHKRMEHKGSTHNRAIYKNGKNIKRHDGDKRLYASNHTSNKHNKLQQRLRNNKVPSFNRTAVKNKAIVQGQKNSSYKVKNVHTPKSRNYNVVSNNQKSFKSYSNKRSERAVNKQYSSSNKPKQQYKSSNNRTHNSTAKVKTRHQTKQSRPSQSRTSNKSRSNRGSERTKHKE
ncbi:MAG: DUF3300 domain-containing protein [Colwellia sp.]|nr:DUF3300 domain-containing protein [Colwellia sp.]